MWNSPRPTSLATPRPLRLMDFRRARPSCSTRCSVASSVSRPPRMFDWRSWSAIEVEVAPSDTNVQLWVDGDGSFELTQHMPSASLAYWYTDGRQLSAGSSSSARIRPRSRRRPSHSRPPTPTSRSPHHNHPSSPQKQGVTDDLHRQSEIPGRRRRRLSGPRVPDAILVPSGHRQARRAQQEQGAFLSLVHGFGVRFDGTGFLNFEVNTAVPATTLDTIKKTVAANLGLDRPSSPSRPFPITAAT